jgi:hypothetical protein
LHREHPMPMRPADIDQILFGDVFANRPTKEIRRMGKMPEAALPNPRRICDARVTIRGRDAPPSRVRIGLRVLAGARSP